MQYFQPKIRNLHFPPSHTPHPTIAPPPFPILLICRWAKYIGWKVFNLQKSFQIFWQFEKNCQIKSDKNERLKYFEKTFPITGTLKRLNKFESIPRGKFAIIFKTEESDIKIVG